MSVLPSVQNRFVSSRSRFLIFSTDRLGPYSPWVLDLRAGLMKQIASPKNLDTQSLCLDGRERLVFLIDDGELREVTLANGRSRSITDGVKAFSLDPASGLLAVHKGHRLYRRSGSDEALVAEDVQQVGPIQPKTGAILFSRSGENGNLQFWYAMAGSKPQMIASGEISNPIWSANGANLLFLRTIRSDNVAVEVRAISPGLGGGEQKVSATTQLAVFSANADGSVLVGASRSKAQPNIMLVLGSVAREITLCEHRTKQPSMAAPVFSPNSQRVYFQSDRDGKAALYSVNVERLIEETD